MILLPLVLTLAIDTNLVEKLDKVYEENKIDDPETLLGTVNKVLNRIWCTRWCCI